MNGVVLRCPACGTTRNERGECDACHEAEVRYFCANHGAGRWLDGPACEACGSRFGESPRPDLPRQREWPRPSREPGWSPPTRDAEDEPRPASMRRRRAAIPRRDAPTPRRDAPLPLPDAPLPRRRRSRGRDRDSDVGLPAGPTLFDILAAVLSGGRRRLEYGTDGDVLRPFPGLDLSTAMTRLRRFVGRLVMVVVVMLVLAFLATVLLLGGLFQVVQVPVGLH